MADDACLVPRLFRYHSCLKNCRAAHTHRQPGKRRAYFEQDHLSDLEIDGRDLEKESDQKRIVLD